MIRSVISAVVGVTFFFLIIGHSYVVAFFYHNGAFDSVEKEILSVNLNLDSDWYPANPIDLIFFKRENDTLLNSIVYAKVGHWSVEPKNMVVVSRLMSVPLDAIVYETPGQLGEIQVNRNSVSFRGVTKYIFHLKDYGISINTSLVDLNGFIDSVH